jgi:hypothetical protein
MKASNSWIGDDGNCVLSWFSSVQAGKTDSDQRLASARRSMMTDRSAPDSDWNVSFWFVVSKSVARCSARHPGRGDFLSMIEKAMSIMTIVFVLIILLFGFDSAGRVKSPRGPQ